MNRRALGHIAGAVFWVVLGVDHVTTLVQPPGHWIEAPLLAFDILGLALSTALLRRELRRRVSEGSEKVTK